MSIRLAKCENYVRATAAHSTLSIDGMDQVECWGSFRVARRFAPHDIRFVQSDGKSMFERPVLRLCFARRR